MRLLKFIFAALLLSAPAPAFAQSKPVVIENAWVRIYEGTTSVYFHILNNAEEPDRLLDVSTLLADKAELIRTRIRSGKYTYLPVKGLEITGYNDERLRPGGIFVRLTGLKRDLHVGDTVPLTLRFERSGHIEVNARVGNQLLGNR
ncbi:MAG: copper chaperone PCu(A)C [Proteobacteria bacterium]|nr:copper chaperone PCu(A)C [Pseudomonadota bacterium]